MDKTVYFLGAGFAMDAGVPRQSDLIARMLQLKGGVEDDINTFKKFLGEACSILPEFQEKFTLEDVFTPIDRCIAENTPFRMLSVEELKKTRQSAYNLIGRVVKESLETKTTGGGYSDYLDVFSKKIIDVAKKKILDPQHRHDEVSIITTNWDITIDTRIHAELRKFGFTNLKAKRLPQAVLDYCCYVSSWEQEDDTVKPGLEVLGSGGFNVKLLKLHGSLNWVKCSRCNRTYVDFKEKIAMRPNLRFERCRHCTNNFGQIEMQNELVSDLIMPTYLKDLSSTQYRLIWQNAGVELSEASKLVFIGYSLPEADFEIRQLIRRMIRNDVEITCVTKGDSSNDIFEKYRIFFGRNVNEFNCGARNYVLNHM